MKNKNGMEIVISRSLGYKTSPEKFLYQWCITWLTKFVGVTQGGFLATPKHPLIYVSKSWHCELFHFKLVLSNLESVERKKKNSKIFRWNNKHCSWFWKGYHFVGTNDWFLLSQAISSAVAQKWPWDSQIVEINKLMQE